EYTYSLACRILAFAAAEQTQRGEYRKYVAQDVKQLCLSMNNGLIRYTAPGQPGKSEWDNSNMQYALLSLWIASECGIEVPQKYWQMTDRHWRATQRDDGGWTYLDEGKKGHSTGTMTAAGVASLFVCGDRLGAGGLNCTGANLPKPLQNGLGWLNENFSLRPKDAKFRGYCLYGLERVGLASGYKFFGQHDWYEEGTSLLAGGGRGAWAGGRYRTGDKKLDVANAAFSLLFLCPGRHPVWRT
ncbi:MAG: hypothetical protein NT031_11075, partial [Planctomycetota bacterium]|nr:hypothetical protein [Planctomycetota bacterium]